MLEMQWSERCFDFYPVFIANSLAHKRKSRDPLESLVEKCSQEKTKQ
jgi:hypothetical protein